MADSAIPLRPRGNERTHKPSPRDRLGRPLSDLRISVMDRCNFRCPYCMPEAIYHRHYPFLASDERLSFDEIRRLATAFAGLGVSFYPLAVPFEVTVHEAAAPDSSLAFLLVGAAILLPIILAYTGYAYWIFRGKTDVREGYH